MHGHVAEEIQVGEDVASAEAVLGQLMQEVLAAAENALGTSYRSGYMSRKQLWVGSPMGMKNDIQQAVAFVGLPDGKGDLRLIGTAFFVEEDAQPGSNKAWGYVVTARHVAEAVAGKDFVLRLNTNNSEVIGVAGKGVRWWVHPTDTTADVALNRWFPPVGVIKYKRINVSDFVTGKMIADGQVTPGDDVFMTGLFVGHPGTKQNLPIVRFGHVAMIPQEPIRTKLGDIEAYLIEARSIGGLSGSPVWVTQTVIHSMGESRLKGIRNTWMLGLISGHWSIAAKGQPPDEAVIGDQPINAGIGIVTPAQKIIDVIGQPEMMELKTKELSELLQEK